MNDPNLSAFIWSVADLLRGDYKQSEYGKVIRIIRHEVIPSCGSFEVRFADGRESEFFYWDDVPARRLRPEMLTQDAALEEAKAFARAERDKTT